MKAKLYRNFLIVVPKKEYISRVKEHLRYWPYVKAFSENTPHFINARICIGTICSPKDRKHFTTRTCELIGLCLRQYGVLVCPNTVNGKSFYRKYTHSLFLRPDDQLKEFRQFIDQLWFTSYHSDPLQRNPGCWNKFRVTRISGIVTYHPDNQAVIPNHQKSSRTHKPSSRTRFGIWKNKCRKE